MKVGDIKEWLSDELGNPFAWQRVVMHLLPSFRSEGYFYHTIGDEDILSDYLINLIDSTIRKFYHVKLPRMTY